jgi:hypothetical protein
MDKPIIADIQFYIWVESNMPCSDLESTEKLLRTMNRVDVGRVYLAYQNNEKIPEDLIPKPDWYEVCDAPPKRKKNAPECVNCGYYGTDTEYQPLPDNVPTYKLQFYSDTYEAHVCKKCIDIVLKYDNIKPSVQFTTQV